MKIHEYQAKAILAKYGVPVPRGEVAFTVDEAEAAAKKIGGSVVVKAQIHAGGRGKGGGVKVAKDAAEAVEIAKKMLGMRLVTHQTGPEGRIVQRLLVEETLPIATRAVSGDCAGSRAGQAGVHGVGGGRHGHRRGGGEIARADFEGSAGAGLRACAVSGAEHGVWNGRGVGKRQRRRGGDDRPGEGLRCDGCFAGRDQSIHCCEDGKVYALDAKFNLDDNALYRHKDLLDLRDQNEEDPLEVEASRFSLNYIKLDGNIACMVNGAGLAMATMDIVKYAGGSPANFLDVGGGANAEQIKNAFRILLSDAGVKAVLINIFGGILRCDILATGVVNAARELNVTAPIVVRMEGTNVEKGQEILKTSGFNFTVADGMRDAAEKVVRAAKGVKA